ncbi:uncharacterized protein LOC129616049 [Condylostylus longicornis]|uniref:uncharacterized protein LOC129616049 n=1 Tax=Condylostylus longicornis TaxID=2530218 RepID=UPI00244DFF23|nr:uncharacterized protein LOC129616049 [Condylostylus longicornis]
MSSDKHSNIRRRIKSKIKSFPKWDSATTIKFLKLYQKHESLWNKKHPLYPDRGVRMNCLRDIRDKMKLPGFDIPLVITKINIVRTMYAKECRKMQQYLQSGEEYNTQLEWFEYADAFLKDIVQHRGTIADNKIMYAKSILKSCDKNRLSLNMVDDYRSDDGTKGSLMTSNETDDENFNQYSDTSSIEIKNEAVNDWPPITSNIINKSRIKNEEQNNLNSEFNMEYDPGLSEEYMVADGNANTDYDDDSNLLCVTPPEARSNKNIYSKYNNVEVEYNNTQNHNIQNKNNFNIEDEFDIFGKSISNQLKKLPLNKAYELEFKIQHLVTNAKLEAIGREPIHL